MERRLVPDPVSPSYVLRPLPLHYLGPYFWMVEDPL